MDEKSYIKVAADSNGVMLCTSHAIVGEMADDDVDTLIERLRRAKVAAAVMRGEQSPVDVGVPPKQGDQYKPVTANEISALYAVEQLAKAHVAAGGNLTPNVSRAIAAVIAAGRTLQEAK